MRDTHPAHVLAVEPPDLLVIEVAGHRRRAITELAEALRPGDWVLLSGDRVVQRVAPDCVEMQARAYRRATGLEIDDDLEAEHHHFPTEDREPAPVRRYRVR